ncbi:hypothetical protein [Pseudogemmobacter bohemicus]|uniref:hypothetical protein n=1 Tax=Pseudogemmobacter bohemicus TaxID=2250708 RepID=UPI0013001D8B|nr:hypothetical protein [Pseudogemmobacter bohemicus]
MSRLSLAARICLRVEIDHDQFRQFQLIPAGAARVRQKHRLAGRPHRRMADRQRIDQGFRQARYRVLMV